MRVKVNREPGLTVHFSEEEARMLQKIISNNNLEYSAKHDRLKKDLHNLLNREGVTP